MSDHPEVKTKTVKVPGPDHPITIERNAHRIVVTVAGRVVADTRDALTLREASYPAVQYVPRKDVDMALLERTDHITYCPYKGDCAYYSPRPVANARSTLSGPTRGPTRRSPRSRTTSRSIPTASTRSANRRRRPGSGASGRATRRKAATRSRDDACRCRYAAGVWHMRAMTWSRPPGCKTRRSCSKRSIHFSISGTTRLQGGRAVLVIELHSTQRAHPTWARRPVQSG
jgi:uncharacterized protein (DUF427 family)